MHFSWLWVCDDLVFRFTYGYRTSSGEDTRYCEHVVLGIEEVLNGDSGIILSLG